MSWFIQSDKCTRLYLVRHAEVEADYQQVFGGTIDMGLSEVGHAQALRLAEFLRAVHIDRLLVSPMRRAQLTLAPLGVDRGRVITLSDLREVDFGVWTGLRWQEVTQRFGVDPRLWLEELEGGRIERAERHDQIRDRASRALTQARDHDPGQTVLLLCHGGLIRFMLALLLDLPLKALARFDIDYASVSVVDWDAGGPTLRLLNYRPWLNAT